VRNADNLLPSCAVVTKSGNLNFLEPSGPLQACNGTGLPLPLPTLRNIPEEPRCHLHGGGSLKPRRLIDGPCGSCRICSVDSIFLPACSPALSWPLFDCCDTHFER